MASSLRQRLQEAFLDSTLATADKLAKQATAAKRTAGDIRRQIDRLSALTLRERDTLAEAASILEAVSDAAGAAKRRRAEAELLKEHRRAAALKAIEAAFADVTDAAGLVVMLATSYSFRTHKVDGQYLKGVGELDRHDANEIQGRDREQALDDYAWRIAEHTVGAVEVEAASMRARFDELRPAIEAKHPELIQWLATELAHG